MDKPLELDKELPKDTGPFEDAKPNRESRAWVGVWMHKAEKELAEARAHLTTDRVSAGDKCATMDERVHKDREIVARIDGLKPEVWERSTPEQRLQAIRELEAALAHSQGREARRVHAVGPEIDDELRQLVEKNFPELLPHPAATGDTTVEVSHGIGFASGRSIEIDHGVLVKYRTVQEACRVVFEEAFHAYQLSAVKNPNRHSEVVAELREAWQTALANYDKDIQTWETYVGNALEVHAKLYAEWMLKEIYG